MTRLLMDIQSIILKVSAVLVWRLGKGLICDVSVGLFETLMIGPSDPSSRPLIQFNYIVVKKMSFSPLHCTKRTKANGEGGLSDHDH